MKFKLFDNLSRSTTKKIFLALLFIFGLFLRTAYLETHPAGFHFDEANAGYNAYSILETGSTVRNGSWPLYLDTFGDFRPMGLVYFIIPSIKIFGLSELAVRLPVAILGALSPLLLFILVRTISKNTKVASLSSIFMTLSPWHINLSRATAEGVIALFFALLIFIFFQLLYKNPKISVAILIYVLMVISYITYHPINLFLLIFFPILTFLYLKMSRSINKKFLLLASAVFLAYVIFPQAYGILESNAAKRFQQVSILGAVNDKIFSQYSQVPPEVPTYVARAFHNKLVNSTIAVSRQYTQYFSPDYLLFHGGLPERYNIPDSGLVNIIEFLGLILFVVLLNIFYKDKLTLFFLIWLIISPMASTITTEEQPNIHRTILMIPALSVLSALALVYFFEKLTSESNKKVTFTIIILVLSTGIFHYFYFFNQYLIHQKPEERLHRQYVSRTIAKELKNVPQDKKILVTTHLLSTDTFVLFFQKVNPKIAQAAYNNGEPGNVSFLNYTFTDENTCASKLDVRKVPLYDYYVDFSYCDMPKIWNVVSVFSNPDGEDSIKLVERKTNDN